MMTRREEFLAAPDLVPAAVLIPLLIHSEPSAPVGFHLRTSAGSLALPLQTEVVLTVRAHTVEHHKGQISFPGGVHEETDRSLEATALRESEEELGLEHRLVEIVAELPDVPTVATRFKVRPYVGLIRVRPEFRPNPAEIGEILHVPLHHLFDERNSVLETFERNDLKYQMRSYQFGSHRIWGATGLILQILLEKFLTKA